MVGLFKDTQVFYQSGKKNTDIPVTIGWIFAFLACLEILAYTYKGVFSIVASWIWLAGMVYLFGSSFWLSVSDLVNDFKNKRYIAPVLMIAFCVITFWGAGITGIRWVDYEAAQEIGAGLSSWSTPDRGYMSLSFWGYPTRQYAFLAIPSLVFGKSLLVLNVTFDFIFIASALSMYRGLKSFLAPVMESPGIGASIIVFGVFTSPLVLLYTRVCEQAMLPSAFTMLAIGCFFSYLRDGKPADAVRLGIVGGFLGAMYTPGLATAGLLAAALVFKAIGAVSGRSRKEMKPYRDSAFLDLGLCLYIVVVTGISVVLLREKSSLTIGATAQNYVSTTIISILTEDPYGLFRGLTIVAIAYLLLSLAGILTVYDVYLSIWVVLVIVMAVMMKGVNGNSYVSIQRATPAIPVLVSAVGYHVISNSKRLKNFGKWIAWILACAAVAVSIAINLVSPIYSKNISKERGIIQTRIVREIKRAIKENGLDRENLTLLYYVDNVYIKNIYDYMKYFEPKMTVAIIESPIINKAFKDGDYIIAAISDATIPADLVQIYGEPTKAVLFSDTKQYLLEMITVNNP
ncbi:MAG: hypothetical protein LBT59_05575 [Clostridiales bacterium]|nr:hypothetical protein [Clostridiales bacterium]